MESRFSIRLFKRIAILATMLSLCVVVLGAYVRLSDAGLGCPDWPGCYGTLSVPESQSAILKAQMNYPDKPVIAHKAWKEMAHRYLAGTLGILIGLLMITSWPARKMIAVSIGLPILLVGIVIFQAMLGMWTVTLLLKPVIVSSHLMGGMTILAILTWISHRHFGTISGRLIQTSSLRTMVRFAIPIIFLQIFLGGWTSSNYAGMACNDFPTCHGQWWPTMDFVNAFHWVRDLGKGSDGQALNLEAYIAIQWIHRLGAYIVFLYMSILAFRLFSVERMRSFAKLLLALLLIQIGLGIANLILHLPLTLAVLHNLGAALLVITLVVINSKITSTSRGMRP
jgi:heme a synthase